MTAGVTKWPEPLSALDAVLLRRYRQLEPHAARAFFNAICRTVDDGQPFEEAMVELLVEMGYSPAEAREKVREAAQKSQTATDWRHALN
jgi:Holliday junction resolvasome RuvABC DNA-binding subunit